MSSQKLQGHFDNPVVTLTVDANTDSDYVQLSLREGQAVILHTSQVGAVINQLTDWLALRAMS